MDACLVYNELYFGMEGVYKVLLTITKTPLAGKVYCLKE